MRVYVLTNPELGWDCVVGVFTSREAAVRSVTETDDPTEDQLRSFEKEYVVHENTLEGER